MLPNQVGPAPYLLLKQSSKPTMHQQRGVRELVLELGRSEHAVQIGGRKKQVSFPLDY